MAKKELYLQRQYFWRVLLTGAVLCVFMNGVVDNQGQAANLMAPLTIVLFCVSCAAAQDMSSAGKVILALLMGCELALVVFTLYVLTATEPKIYPYLYSVEQFLSPRHSLAITIFLGAMLAGYGWRVSNPGKNIS